MNASENPCHYCSGGGVCISHLLSLGAASILHLPLRSARLIGRPHPPQDLLPHRNLRPLAPRLRIQYLPPSLRRVCLPRMRACRHSGSAFYPPEGEEDGPKKDKNLCGVPLSWVLSDDLRRATKEMKGVRMGLLHREVIGKRGNWTS
jgi:hypothetical protein